MPYEIKIEIGLAYDDIEFGMLQCWQGKGQIRE